MEPIAPCPWCGQTPSIEPQDPERDGTAWGAVRCSNPQCAAEVRVMVYEDALVDITGEWLDSPEAIKAEAVKRWNKRA